MKSHYGSCLLFVGVTCMLSSAGNFFSCGWDLLGFQGIDEEI